MDAKTYWNNRYFFGGNSGYGSRGEQLAKKLGWLKGLDIKSISEIGCGDFYLGANLLNQYKDKIQYIGQDIAESIIKTNRELYPWSAFTSNLEEVPPADLVLCIDVLFHILKDDEVEPLLKELESRWTKYLAITAYERDEVMGSHVRIRNFDYKRFGEPLIREVVEEDGQLYFYLFKRKPKIDLTKVSCCLITKDAVYPKEILDHLKQFPFGEVLTLTNCDSPFRKHELFAKAKFDLIYYQDDDAICPVAELAEVADPKMINVAMKPGHFEVYADLRMTMGLGWGSFFPKSVLKALDKYTAVYGEDALFKRDTEKILTELVFPQNRFVLPIKDLPSAMAEDRLWRQPEHYPNMEIIENRCQFLLEG